MLTISVAEAKAQLAELVEKVLAGEEVVLSHAGRPVARLVPYKLVEIDTSPRELGGIWTGKVWMADDFDELPEELARAFGVID